MSTARTFSSSGTSRGPTPRLLSGMAASRGTKQGSKRSPVLTHSSPPAPAPTQAARWDAAGARISGPSAPALPPVPGAPGARKPTMTSLVEGWLHTSSGVCPLAFRRRAVAPALRRQRAASWRPMQLATCSAVQPESSAASKKMPRLTSSWTICRLPMRQAACSKVVPLLSRQFMLAPRSRSQRTAATLPEPAKCRAARSRSPRSLSVAMKTAPAGSHRLVRRRRDQVH
mmetsp:Transcript_128280/g.410174  ORF Transcript_128280/g.410174 Transcript_128280/m.410174 type:complete len:229 (-) Transcript_128280:217-903(-)